MIQAIEDKQDWDDFISSFEDADLYHTYAYHFLDKGNAKPVLIKYVQGNVCIGLPLLIRKISGTSYCDATSVYGYAGPIYKNVSEEFDNTHFKNELLDYLTSINVVSVFSRLNPFLSKQDKILQGIGDIEEKGPIVAIDLKKSIELQRQGFSRRLKGQLNKSRRYCTIKSMETTDDIQEFIKVYHENMDRVNAKPMYYFDDKYYFDLFNCSGFKTQGLMAYHNETGDVIGVGLFIYRNSVVHYHLSGTKNEYLSLMPTKLLIDEMRLRATQMGMGYLNLGGGLASSEDSLLKFKSSFSKDLWQFKVWELIVLPEVYKELTQGRNLQEQRFFPLYRSECVNE
jgi:lipid II:glycine glycyltransferase (peptidoglycan interpeptide bridge formation enzyme)